MTTDGAVLANGVVVTSTGPLAGTAPRVIPGGAVAWQGDRLVAVDDEVTVRRRYPAARVLDARGGLILPGLVNLHHHFYSALARGLDPRAPMTTFAEVLDRLWWRLDRALDPDTVRLSAELCAADCIRWGCTTVFDHHASPNFVAGSLDTIAEVLDAAGLSGVLCYEITDRNGHAEARAGTTENFAFIAAHAQHPRIRGTVGLHASFTLRNETLAAIAEQWTPSAGCHIHAGEDPIDAVASREAFGRGPVERLAHVGLLGERTILAHGIHLSADEYDRIAQHRAVVVHNPESNANNRVGHLDTARIAARGCLVGLGTDGMSSSMLRALRAAFLHERGERRNPSGAQTVLPALLANNAEVARRFLGEPFLGALVEGAPADVTVIDAPPPTTLDGGNLFGHLVFGAAEAGARHTIARGRILLEDYRHTTLDLESIATRARTLSPALWDRFHGLQWGTSFLG